MIYKPCRTEEQEGWDPINPFYPTKFLCLSQARTWVSKVICLAIGIFWFKVRGDNFFLLILVKFLTITTQWLSGGCLSQLSNFSAIPWWEQVNFQWDDDEVFFVLDQHTELDFYCATCSSLKQQVYMSLHSDKLFWFRANQSSLLSYSLMLHA